MLELKGYNLLGELNDEQDLLESFISDHKFTTYVCDAITEAADSATPIYYNDIWEHARDISEYIEEAVSEGLVDTSNFDLSQTFQAGYIRYYTQSLYNNLDAMVYNYIVEEVNDYINELDEMLISELDMEAIEERIEDEAGDFDNNNQMSIIDDIIQGVKELIDEQIEELEESEE
jgi:hypothetical protein